MDIWYFANFSIIATYLLFGVTCELCNIDKFVDTNPRVLGEWWKSEWSNEGLIGLMKLDDDEENCRYTLTLGCLSPNTDYKWKVIAGSDSTIEYGCSGDYCHFTTNSEGKVHLIFSMKGAFPRLTAEGDDAISIDTVDVYMGVCDEGKCDNIRAIGEWNNFQIDDERSIMNFSESSCGYELAVGGLVPHTDYTWAIVTGGKYFSCGQTVYCTNKTDENGAIRYTFCPLKNEPSADFNYDSNNLVHSEITTHTPPIPTTTPFVENPIKDCQVVNCPVCNEIFSSKLIRAVGDWTQADLLGSSIDKWNPAEPLGLMTYEAKKCHYTLLLKGLEPNKMFHWKVTVDNSFKENYGCYGQVEGKCPFVTNSEGSVRLVFDVKRTTSFKLTHDDFVDVCGDDICSEKETCLQCEEDCGQCVRPICGNAICEPDEAVNGDCPADCGFNTETSDYDYDY